MTRCALERPPSPGRGSRLPRGRSERARDRVGLHGGDDERTGHNRDDSKDACQNLILHASCNVVGRAAAEGSISRTNLEDLRKCGLEKGGRHADQGHDPHPEDRTWAAEHERRGHAEDVADTHACGQRDRECLEGGDTAVCALARAETERIISGNWRICMNRDTTVRYEAHANQDAHVRCSVIQSAISFRSQLSVPDPPFVPPLSTFNKVVGQRLPKSHRDGAIFFAFSRKLDADAGRSGKIEA